MFWTKRACVILVIVNVVVGLCKGLEMIAVHNLMKNIKKNDGLHLFNGTRVTTPISITDFGFDNSRVNLHNRNSSIELAGRCSRHISDNNNARNANNLIATGGYKII